MTRDLVQLLDTPVYPPSLAARLIGLRSDRVTRWLRGYSFTYRTAGGTRRRGRKAPVVVRRDGQESNHASFLDLIDLLFVKQFLNHGLTLQRVRRALEEASELVGGHHFAQRSFFTDGREIYMQLDDSAENLLQLLSNGQWVIAPVIKQTARQIEFDEDTGFAERWFPLGKRGGIVLDPRIAFGAPTLTKRGVKTANVFDLFVAEEEKTQVVSDWMNLRPKEVERAVQFERQIRHAA